MCAAILGAPTRQDLLILRPLFLFPLKEGKKFGCADSEGTRSILQPGQHRADGDTKTLANTDLCLWSQFAFCHHVFHTFNPSIQNSFGQSSLDWNTLQDGEHITFLSLFQ